MPASKMSRTAALALLVCHVVTGHWSHTITNKVPGTHVDEKAAHARRMLQEMGEDEPKESPNAKWRCDPVAEEHKAEHNKYKIRAVNLGSWLVLEPWITPTLFFQFLGKEVEAAGVPGESPHGASTQDSVGMDMYSFCLALGPDEGNRQLRAHWDSWVTETDIAQLATMGINTIRLPVGDWMYKPYGPYVGCTDGALEQVERLFWLAHHYNIGILLDIHAVQGSQNGFDNSGRSLNLEWTTFSSTKVAGAATFVHWPYRSANWMGTFDPHTATYVDKNEAHLQHTLDVIRIMVDMYKFVPSVIGIEPVNEPWQFTPVKWLKEFYWEGYQIVRETVPQWLFLMHDAFMFDVNIWGDFMLNCPNIGLDTHIYHAWLDPMPQASYLSYACDVKNALVAMEKKGMPVVVGEYSLATDNCAMWLNGFNDNLPGFPRVQCTYTPCPLPYTGAGVIPGAPVNPNSPPQGPFGTGSSTPSYGMCPIDRRWHNENMFMKDLSRAKLHAFEAVHGWAFWNFKSELEPRWSYIKATELGYFPRTVANLDKDLRVIHACDAFEGRSKNNDMPNSIYAELTPDGGGLRTSHVALLAALAAALAVAAVAVAAKRRQRADGFEALPTEAEQ